MMYAFNRAVLLCLLVVLLPSVNAAQINESDQTLTILNWDDYLDPALVKAFEQRFGVRVNQVYYESDDHRDELMAASQGRGYDVLVVSGLMVESYQKQGWLQKKSAFENDQYLAARWVDAYASSKEFMVPYFWGTLGIAYRQDLLTVPITRWQQFFNPNEELAGKIALINSSRDVVGMAMKSLGYSANSNNPEHLNQAKALLLKFAPHVKTLDYIDFDEESAMLTGEIVASMMYSGDTLMLQEHSDQVRYVLPDEGGNIWVDYIGVAASSLNKTLAWEFINFLNTPKHAAQLAQFIYYATPNHAAEDLLPKDFTEDPVIYPSAKALEQSEYYQPLKARTRNRINRVFSQLKAQATSNENSE